MHKKITPPQDAAPVALRAPSLGADARPYPHTRYLPLPCNDVFGFLPIRYMTCRFLACCPPTRSLHCFFECSLRASSAHRSTKSPEGLPKKTHRERASGSLFIPLFSGKHAASSKLRQPGGRKVPGFFSSVSLHPPRAQVHGRRMIRHDAFRCAAAGKSPTSESLGLRACAP